MIFGVIWLKWVPQPRQIEFVVSHMVDMAHLVQTLADMVVDQVALAVLVNRTFPELVNTPASLDQVGPVE